MYSIKFKPEDKEKLKELNSRFKSQFIEQSLEWFSFQSKLSSRADVSIFVISEKKDDLNSAILFCGVTVIKTVFGKTYLHLNRGPVFRENKINQESFSFFVEELKKYGIEKNAIYIRFDWPFREDFDLKALCSDKIALKDAHFSNQPVRTLMIDLTKTEQEILNEMKPKGRYNIKIAQKKGAVVLKSIDQKDVGTFYAMIKETATRDGFSVQPQEFYEKMFASLKEENRVKLYMAESEGKIIAANIVTYYGDTSTYYYGSSSNEYRNLMAPYLLQYEAIMDAKKLGYKYYDFLGISADEKTKDSWAGITDFKRKFGGFDFVYHKPSEIILSHLWYSLIIGLKKLKKVIK